MKTKGEVKKEFDVFAGRVAKLESLGQELKALDTKGFESDAAIIRAKLKDIGAIPQIERELGELKSKILKKHSNVGVGAKKFIRESELLHQEAASLRNKIRELEKTIEKKKSVSCKKQLSKKELEFVRDVPQLEKSLLELKRKFDEHLKSGKVKVDSGVGVLVDSKFDDFILEIKADLSEKLREKELGMDKKLSEDLEMRKKYFADRYNELVEKYHEDYKNKLGHELKKTVQEKFDKMLKKKLDEERKNLVRKLVRENAGRLYAQKRKLMASLESEYNLKERKLEKGVGNLRKELLSREKALTVMEKSDKKELDRKKAEFERKMRQIRDRKGKMEKTDRLKLERKRAEYDKKKEELAWKEIQMEKKNNSIEEARRGEIKRRRAELEKKKGEINMIEEKRKRALAEKEEKMKKKERIKFMKILKSEKAEMERRRAGIEKEKKKLERKRGRMAEKMESIERRERARFGKILEARKIRMKMKDRQIMRERDKYVKKKQEFISLERQLEEIKAKHNVEFEKKVSKMRAVFHEKLRKVIAENKKNDRKMREELERKEGKLKKIYAIKYESEMKSAMEKQKAKIAKHILEQINHSGLN